MKKILLFFIIGIFFISSIGAVAYQENKSDIEPLTQPDLEMEFKSGTGITFGATVVITNNGAEIFQGIVELETKIQECWVMIEPKVKQFWLNIIPGESKEISTGFLFGLGPALIGVDLIGIDPPFETVHIFDEIFIIFGPFVIITQ